VHISARKRKKSRIFRRVKIQAEARLPDTHEARLGAMKISAMFTL
jgi:hypothetical protein